MEPNSVTKLLNAIQGGDAGDQNAAFQNVMREKVATALDVRKVGLTSEIFNAASQTEGLGEDFTALRRLASVTPGKSYTRWTNIDNRVVKAQVKIVDVKVEAGTGRATVYFKVNNDSAVKHLERKIFLAKLVTEGVDEPLLEDFADELNEVAKVTGPGIMFDPAKGIRKGVTYQRKFKSGPRGTEHQGEEDVKVLDIDRNIVKFQRGGHDKGTLPYQPERQPIDEFEKSLLTS